jgi:hypothetical protein
MQTTRLLRLTVTAIAVYFTLLNAAAQAVTVHPWIASRTSTQAQAYIVNIKDGEQVQMPMLVQFGLSGGWGLAPIEKLPLAKRDITTCSSTGICHSISNSHCRLTISIDTLAKGRWKRCLISHQAIIHCACC